MPRSRDDDVVPDWLTFAHGFIDGVPLYRLSDALLARIGQAVRVESIGRSCMTLSAWKHWRRGVLVELDVYNT